MPRPALWYQGGLPAGSLRASRATRPSPQMSLSFVFVPELSPRETKFARPAAPAAAIASNAPTASLRAARRMPAGSLAGPTITKSFHITVRPTGSYEKPSRANCCSSAGERAISTVACPARGFLVGGWGRVADQHVALPGARVRDGLAGADGHEAQVVLRKAPLELRSDELIQHAGVAHARGALHDQRALLLRAGRRGSGERHGEREHDRGRAAAGRSLRHKLRPLRPTLASTAIEHIGPRWLATTTSPRSSPPGSPRATWRRAWRCPRCASSPPPRRRPPAPSPARTASWPTAARSWSSRGARRA